MAVEPAPCRSSAASTRLRPSLPSPGPSSASAAPAGVPGSPWSLCLPPIQRPWCAAVQDCLHGLPPRPRLPSTPAPGAPGCATHQSTGGAGLGTALRPIALPQRLERTRWPLGAGIPAAAWKAGPEGKGEQDAGSHGQQHPPAHASDRAAALLRPLMLAWHRTGPPRCLACPSRG